MPLAYNTTAITWSALDSLAVVAAGTTWVFSPLQDTTTADCHDIIVGGDVNTDSGWADGDKIDLYLTAAGDYTSSTTAQNTMGGGIGAAITANSTEVEGTAGAFRSERLIHVASLVTSATTQEAYSVQPFSLTSALGYLPGYWQLALNFDPVGAETLHTTGGNFYYTTKKYPTS